MSDAPDTAAELPADDEPARRRVAPYIALVVAIVLAGLFVVLASGKSGSDDKAGVIDSPLLDRPAPSVRGTTIDGEPFDLSRRKGSWVVINVFNSDCAPCKAEHVELLTFVSQQSTLGVLGAEMYTIAQPPDTEETARAFFAERGGDWPVLLDEDGTLSVAFGVAQVPETFIVDPDGYVRVRWAGPIDAVTLAALVQQERLAYSG